MRRIALISTVSLLLLSACGGSDDTSASSPGDSGSVATDAPAVTTAAPTSEPDPAPTDAPTSEPALTTTAAPAATDGEPVGTAAPGDSAVIEVSLVEWAVESPADLVAGTITFDVSNTGNFPHQFAIARGDSYETLPLTGGGAIDEATLGADFLGRTSNVPSGGTETIEFDLEPGNYVFFCNIAGTVSHAAQGQVLSVTVAPE